MEKRVTKGKINAVENAGACIDAFNIESGLSDKQLEVHRYIGNLLIEHAGKVVEFLHKLDK